MESSCPHPGGRRDARRATGRPFPWLEDCALLADPLGFARKQHFSSQEGAPPCLAHLTRKCVCVCEHSALQLTPTLFPIPSPLQLLECPDVFSILVLCAPCLPRPRLQAQILFEGEERGSTFHPHHLDPSDFPGGTHGKGSTVRVVSAGAVHCLDIRIPNFCQSTPG